MATNKQYIDVVLEQCDLLSARAMMKEYVLFYNNKVIGGVYDDRLLIKPTPRAKALLPNAKYQRPYDGAKAMILVEDISDKAFLKKLVEEVWQDVPERKYPRPKKKK